MYKPSADASKYAQNLVGSIDLTAIMIAYDAGKRATGFTYDSALIKEIYYILATNVSAEDHIRMITRLVDEWRD